MRIFLSVCSCFFLFLSFSACPASKEIPDTSAPDKELVVDKILVTLEEKGTPERMIAEFSEYQLQSKGRSSRTENKYLLVFDPTLIQPKKMLSKIQAFPGVVNAQFLEYKKK